MGTFPIGDEEKLAELILYISQKSVSDPRFGSVKLNKILYFCDFLAFGNWGRPITEVDYQHLPQGPAPRRLKPVRNQMEQKKDLAVAHVPLKSGNVQIRTVALRKPDLSKFTGEEIALVDEIIESLWNDDADTVSDRSHQYVGWKMTKEGQSIPYGSIFLSDEPLSAAEIQRGREIAAELNLVA